MSKVKELMNDAVRVEEYLISKGFTDVNILSNPGYSTAFVGVTSTNQAVYDFDKMVKYLVERGYAETDADAVYFIENDTIPVIHHSEPFPPIILYSME